MENPHWGAISSQSQSLSPGTEGLEPTTPSETKSLHQTSNRRADHTSASHGAHSSSSHARPADSPSGRSRWSCAGCAGTVRRPEVGSVGNAARMVQSFYCDLHPHLANLQELARQPRYMNEREDARSHVPPCSHPLRLREHMLQGATTKMLRHPLDDVTSDVWLIYDGGCIMSAH